MDNSDGIKHHFLPSRDLLYAIFDFPCRQQHTDPFIQSSFSRLLRNPNQVKHQQDAAFQYEKENVVTVDNLEQQLAVYTFEKSPDGTYTGEEPHMYNTALSYIMRR